MAEFVQIRELGQHVDATVIIRGWVEHTRIHGKVAFLVVRDGTGSVQGVIVQKQVAPEIWESLPALTLESSVHMTGSVRAEPRAPGGYELGVTTIRLIGPSPDYPTQEKEH